MRVAISNIAWPREWDDRIAGTLRAAGAEGLEVALTRLWDDPLSVSKRTLRECRAHWESQGLPIIAAQALLFGRPELVLFGTDEARRSTLEYLRIILSICGEIGATRAVFGSPGNRRRGSMDAAEAEEIAAVFFEQLGATAFSSGVTVVLEANPTAYGCDFITSAAEAIRMVRRVNSPGLRVHLDTGCMSLAGDDPEASVACADRLLCHVHASEPELAPVSLEGTARHQAMADALRAHRYEGWVSVEMRATEVTEPTELADCVSEMVQVYGG